MMAETDHIKFGTIMEQEEHIKVQPLVRRDILKRHLRGCVRESFVKGKREDKEEKIDEVIKVLQNFRKY